MVVHYELNGIQFSWDSDKAELNRSKHGVTFEQAAEAFFDPFLRVVDADDHSEARDAIIAMDERWHVLYVVHLVLADDVFRIISARRASRQERNYYEA